MLVIELRGTAPVFTLADGSTLRIRPRQKKEVEDRLISEEMRVAEQLKHIAIRPSAEVVEVEAVIEAKQEVFAVEAEDEVGEDGAEPVKKIPLKPKKATTKSSKNKEE